MKKRFASLALALALCLSLLPSAALAEGEEPTTPTVTEVQDESGLNDAISKGGDVKLTENIELTNPLTISQTVTLDLNGKTLTGNETNYPTKITIYGSLTITDSDSGGTGTIDKNITLQANPDSTFHMTGNAINNGILIIEGNTKFTMDGNAQSTNMIQVSGQTSDAEPVTICGSAKVTGTIQILQPQENAAGIKLKDRASVNMMCSDTSGTVTKIEMQDNAVIDKVETLIFRNPKLSGNAKLGSKDSILEISATESDLTIKDRVQLYGKEIKIGWDTSREFVLGGNASITGAVTVKNGPNAKMVMMDDSAIYGNITFAGWDVSFEIQDNAKIDGTISNISSDESGSTVSEVNLIVKFGLNGGDTPAETENSPYANQTVKFGEKVAQPTTPTKSGYRFSGWYYNGSAWNFEEGVTAPMTLTAQWSKKSSGSSSSPSYAVTVPDKTAHGNVTVSPTNARRGSTVTISVQPDSGYVLETLTVTDSFGNEQKLTDKGDGKYTFTMPSGKVEVKATFQEDNSVLNAFYDVPNDAYYFEAVKWAVANGITNGVSENLFGPDQGCTRAQIVTFLWRAAGSPVVSDAMDRTDVPADAYYAEAVRWALREGITKGTGERVFSPDATCTRAQAVTFLARALNAKAEGAATFDDVPAGSYYAEAVAWAAANGVTNGMSDSLFGPEQSCTRAQIVTFLYRAYIGK